MPSTAVHKNTLSSPRRRRGASSLARPSRASRSAPFHRRRELSPTKNIRAILLGIGRRERWILRDGRATRKAGTIPINIVVGAEDAHTHRLLETTIDREMDRLPEAKTDKVRAIWRETVRQLMSIGVVQATGATLVRSGSK